MPMIIHNMSLIIIPKSMLRTDHVGFKCSCKTIIIIMTKMRECVFFNRNTIGELMFSAGRLLIEPYYVVLCTMQLNKNSFNILVNLWGDILLST